MIVTGLLVNLFTHTSVQSSLQFYIAGMIVLCYAALLWIRLSN